MDYSKLPAMNAALNATSGVLLVLGYIFIRQRLMKSHTICMLAACGTSTLFLISYLTYHFHHGSTRFQGEGPVRLLYFAILISHTILAVVIVPLAIVTLWRGLTGDFVKHVKVSRVTFPLWLYVSVTGVVIYFMLYHLYPPSLT
jgi:putative membrane protein